MLRRSLLFLLISSAVGLEDGTIQFTLDFFEIRNVKSVCLLTCGDKTWNQKFTKNASKLSIAVSHVNIDESLANFNSIDECLNRVLTSAGVLVDAKCPFYKDVTVYASENSFFDENHKWLIVDVDTWISNTTPFFKHEEVNDNMSWLVKTFEKLNTSVDADITVSLQKGSENNIYEVYSFGKIRGAKDVVNYLGNWRNRTGSWKPVTVGDRIHLENSFPYRGIINIIIHSAPERARDGAGTGWIQNLNGYKYYRRWNFENSSLNIVVVMSTPPKVFKVDMIIGDTPYRGVAIITMTATRVLEEISQLHNIKFNYTIMDRWIGDYKRNSPPVAATSLYFREQDITPVLRFAPEIFQRLDMVSLPITAIETRYYYRIPTTGPGKFENQFLRPLTNGVWGCVIAVISLCAIILFLTAKAERRPAAAQFAVFSVAASFCQQYFEDNSGPDERCRESSAQQLTVLVTGVSCVLIYNYYTSSVVSWLLNGPPPSIKSLQELLESPLSLIFEDMGYTRSWLKNPTYYYNNKNSEVEDKLRRYKVFKKKKGEPLLVPLEEGIKMVKAGGYAYHTEVYNANALISRTFTQEELCELGSLQSIEKTPLYVTIPKGSPYKEFFNWNLIRLHETGIVSRNRHRTSNPEISCEGSSPRALALGGAAPAFLLLAFGYLLAAVIVLMERFISKTDFNFEIRRFKDRLLY